MPKYGYIRVSSYRKPTNTNSQEGQKKALMDMGVDSSNIFVDTLTGSKPTYPELDKLMSVLRQGDTLVVTKLDRLVSSVEAGEAMIAKLFEQGIGVHILNMGLMNTTSAGKSLYAVLRAFAEFGRDVSVERALAGKAKAREDGVRVDGRPPKYSAKDYDPAMRLLLDEGVALTEVARRTGINRSALGRERDRRKAAIVLSSKDEVAEVEKAEPSTTALERESEARAAELSEKLSIIPSKVPVEEWVDSVRELESLQAQFPENRKIALCLAMGRSHVPKNKYTLELRKESVERLETLLLRFSEDVFAGHLAKGLCLLISQQKKQAEKETAMQRVEELLVKYPNSEGVATWLAHTLEYNSGAKTTEEWEGIVCRLGILSDSFKDNEPIRRIYEAKKKHLLWLQNPESDY